MNGLRFVLIGLAALVFVSLGWRWATNPQPVHPEAPSPIQRIVVSRPTTPPAAPAPAALSELPPSAPVASATPAAPAGEAQPSSPPPSGPPAVQPPVPQATGISPEAARASIESSLRATPELAGVFDAIRTQFPAVAERALDSAASKLKSPSEKPSPDAFIESAMRELRQSSGVLAAKAGPGPLSAVFDAQASTLAELAQTDPRICADFLYGSSSPEFADFAAGHRGLLAKADLADIEAMADGRRQQINRGAPTPDDFKLVEAGLAAKGLSSDEIAALLDGKSLNPPVPDARLCANARTYLDVLRGLPEDARLRIYGLAAELLARS